MLMERAIGSVAELYEVADGFVQELKKDLQPKQSATVVGLFGDLGAGKTTFVKAVAKIMGVDETVTSPTFVIEKIYKLTDQKFDHLIHIDAYRIEKEDELLHLGWKEILENHKNIIFLEWPDRVPNILPDEMIKIHLTPGIDENSRRIIIEH